MGLREKRVSTPSEAGRAPPERAEGGRVVPGFVCAVPDLAPAGKRPLVGPRALRAAGVAQEGDTPKGEM